MDIFAENDTLKVQESLPSFPSWHHIIPGDIWCPHRKPIVFTTCRCQNLLSLNLSVTQQRPRLIN